MGLSFIRDLVINSWKESMAWKAFQIKSLKKKIVSKLLELKVMKNMDHKKRLWHDTKQLVWWKMSETLIPVTFRCNKSEWVFIGLDKKNVTMVKFLELTSQQTFSSNEWYHVMDAAFNNDQVQTLSWCSWHQNSLLYGDL